MEYYFHLREFDYRQKYQGTADTCRAPQEQCSLSTAKTSGVENFEAVHNSIRHSNLHVSLLRNASKAP